MEINTNWKKATPVLILLLMTVLWATQSFLLFHTSIELVTVFIALMIFVISKWTYRYSKNKILEFIGIAFFYVAIIDIIHVFAYKGMGLIGWATTNSATQLWIAGRTIQILAIAVSPRFFNRIISKWIFHLVLLAITSLVIALIRYDLFFDCYIDGQGLTLFKIVMEYLITILAFVCILRLNKIKIIQVEKVKINLRIALLFFMASEMSFTLYADVYGVMNALGHVFKLLSFWYFWEMTAEIGFSRPYANLEESSKEKSIRDQLTGAYNRQYFEEQLSIIDRIENLPIIIVHASLNGLKLINDAMGRKAGDTILKLFVNMMKSVCIDCPTEHFLSRIGGDQFVVVFLKAKPQSGSRFIECMKESMAMHKVNEVPISASFGSAEKNEKFQELNSIYIQAEDDMYDRKKLESPSVKRKTIDLLLQTLFNKSQRELLHSKRVSELCVELSVQLGMTKESIAELNTAGIMHDIGKIGVSDEILNKPSILNESEWKEIKNHPELGYNLLNSVDRYSPIAGYVLSHHERWDGKGYPHGLAGESIPFQSRIIAMADAYDAMVSDRTYKVGLSKEEAVIEITRCAGKQFDPQIAKVFVESVLNEHWDST